MKRILVCLFLVVFALGIGPSAFAGIVTNYVWSGGANVSPYTSWATAAHSIQAAVNVCSNYGWGVVMVAAGTYNLPSALNVSNGVRVVSQSGAAATILNANQLGRCAYLSTQARMSGFTFTGGRVNGGSGGGVYLGEDCTVEDSTITYNYAASGGGACADKSAEINNCMITHNTAAQGGGVDLGSGRMRDCIVQDNFATNKGGAVIMDKWFGYLYGPMVDDCIISRNQTDGYGGGVHCGIGLLRGCEIRGNTAGMHGGGIYGMYATVHDTTFAGNNASQGGGIFCGPSGASEFSRCVIDSNSASFGGGVLMNEDDVIVSCAITRNHAYYSGGGVFSLKSGYLEACTIDGNTANDTGGALYGGAGLCIGTYVATTRHVICYFNTDYGSWPGNWVGQLASYYSCMNPAPAGTANFSADPQFLDRSALNLRLRASSPCVDWGGTRVLAYDDVLDVDRPLDGDNNGTAICDIGAYERVNRRADTDGDGYRDLLEVSRYSNPREALWTPYALNDYDGDGATDLAVHEEKTGAWFIRSLNPTSPPPAFATIIGGPGRVAVPGHYAGTECLTSYAPSTGSWISRSLPFPSSFEEDVSWGGPGMTAVPGEYRSTKFVNFDPAVYEQSTGKWFIRDMDPAPPICFGLQWGGSGMVPVFGDYDGDRTFDLAVYQESTGNWFIRSLLSGIPICFGQNWGGPGLTPVPGDFNADGLWDLAVYQEATGNWFIRSLGPVSAGNPPICFGQNWGGPGLTPAPGDFNGDGMDDLAVYQRSTGNWFIRALGPVGPGNPPIVFGMNWGGPSMKPVGSP